MAVLDVMMAEAAILDYEVERSWAAEPLFYRAPHPPSMTPRLYQLAAVEYALARDNVIFGDEPGLGKTAQCVLVSNAIKARKTLAIVPASLRLNWEREVWAWSMIPNVKTHAVLKSKDGIPPWAHWVILSYDMLRNKDLLAAILNERWDHLVLDEGHYLKDPKGNQRIRPICAEDGVASVCGRISLATGTLMPNQPVECYNAVRLLDWDAIDGASLDEFRETYYDYGEGFITIYDKAKKCYVQKYSKAVRNVPINLDDLRNRLRANIMIRRLKADVLTELPDRQWHLFPLAETAAMKKALAHSGWDAVRQMHDMAEDEFNSSIPIDGAISTARRVLGEAKAPHMAKYVLQLLEEGVEKIVVAAWHHSVLKVLRDALASVGMVYMDGSTSPIAKQQAVDAFQSDKGVRVILGQMLPLSKGWTLTAAQDVVLCEPYWVPGENEQFLDRIHRYGQKGDIVIGHVPVVPDSLDERVLAEVIRKGTNVQKALDG